MRIMFKHFLIKWGILGKSKSQEKAIEEIFAVLHPGRISRSYRKKDDRRCLGRGHGAH